MEDDHCDVDLVIETASGLDWGAVRPRNYFLCFRYKLIR